MAQLSANENELIRAYVAKLMSPEQEAAFLALVRQKPDLQTELEKRQQMYYKALFAEINQPPVTHAGRPAHPFHHWLNKLKTVVARFIKPH